MSTRTWAVHRGRSSNAAPSLARTLRRAVLLVAVVVLSGGGGVSGLPLEAPPTVFRNQLPFFHKDRWKKGHLFSKKDAQVERSVSEDELRRETYTRLIIVGAVSGAMAGAVTDFLMHPIDKIKTRIQSGSAGDLIRGAGPILAMIELFRGCSQALVCSTAYYGLYFAAYEPVREYLQRYVFTGGGSAATVLASLVGTFVMFTLRVPCEVVKTRAMTGDQGSPVEAAKCIYRKDGAKAFFTGYSGLALVEYPFNVIEMSFYEALRLVWQREISRGGELAAWETCVVAALADGVASLITNPFDVVKVRLMTQAGMAKADRKYKGGAVAAVTQIMREEGFAGLMAGCWIRVLWMTVGGMIFWLVLEESQKMIRNWTKNLVADKPQDGEKAKLA